MKHLVISCLLMVAGILNGQEFASWFSANEGTIGNTYYSMHDIGSTTILENYDYSDETFYKIPLSNSVRSLTIRNKNNWKIKFDKPIDNLYLYIRFWVPDIYEFDQDFEVVSLTPYIRLNNRINFTTNNVSGIIKFSKPIDSLTVKYTENSGFGLNGFTFYREITSNVSLSNNSDLSIYSYEGMIFIKNKESYKENLTLVLFDTTGREVYKESNITPGTSIETGLIKGFYFAVLLNQKGNKLCIEKIIL